VAFPSPLAGEGRVRGMPSSSKFFHAFVVEKGRSPLDKAISKSKLWVIVIKMPDTLAGAKFYLVSFPILKTILFDILLQEETASIG
jgi:hypothetical protein